MRRITIFLFFLTVLSSCCAQSQSSCTTPDGRNGVCKTIGSCTMLKLCRGRPRGTAAIRTFLENSHAPCGKTSDGKPKVCCENIYLPTATSLTANPCYPEILASTKFPNNCGKGDRTSRIVNGEKSYPEEFPWVALLEVDTGVNGMRTPCAGALISNNYVLTSAHCLRNLPHGWEVLKVRFGEYNTDIDPDLIDDDPNNIIRMPPVTSIEIEKEIVHEKFSSGGPDIALLKLKTPVTFSSTVQPICLPGTIDEPPVFTCTGWGQTTTTRESSIKQKVELPHVTRDQCQAVFAPSNMTLQDWQFCAGGQGRDACKGDSGGPLMAVAVDKKGILRWTIFGIISSGIQACGTVGVPSIFTKVSLYTDWISKNMV